jgi:hypothetical protein
MTHFTWPELLKSSALTFLTAFALVIVPELDSLTTESFSDGTIVGLLVAVLRLGLKLLLEEFLLWRTRA